METDSAGFSVEDDGMWEIILSECKHFHSPA